MKRFAIAAAIVAALAATADAQPPARGNISLFADDERAYASYCEIPWGYSIAKAEMWIWCEPGENGMWSAEFAVAYPSNVMPDRVTHNALLAARQGDLSGGITASFGACQSGWCWIAHQTLYVSSLEQTCLEIVPHPVSGALQFFTCAVGNPAEPCLKGTDLRLNAADAPCLTPETAIEAGGSTWGALKSLFGG